MTKFFKSHTITFVLVVQFHLSLHLSRYMVLPTRFCEVSFIIFNHTLNRLNFYSDFELRTMVSLHFEHHYYKQRIGEIPRYRERNSWVPTDSFGKRRWSIKFEIFPRGCLFEFWGKRPKLIQGSLYTPGMNQGNEQY